MKQPYFIHYSDERVMAMAGLYDNWKDAEGNWLTTFTILTTDSSKKLQWYGSAKQFSSLDLQRCSSSTAYQQVEDAGESEGVAAGFMTGCQFCCLLRRWRLRGSLRKFLMQSETTVLLSWSLAISRRLHEHNYTVLGCLEEGPRRARFSHA